MVENLKTLVKKEYTEENSTLCFETTPISKVFVLSILSYGIYDIILAYTWWKTLKQKFGYKVSPFWRGFFNEFTNFKLFQFFEKYFNTLKIKGKSFSGTSLATVYFILVMHSNVLSLKYINLIFQNKLTDGMDFLISLITWVWALICAWIIAFIQHKINKTNEQHFPNAPKNPWKTSNIIWTVVLVIYIILSYFP